MELRPELLLLLPLWYVAFLLAVTCHEAAHALAARLGGDDTAYLGGQVSLNPVPHLQREPLGTMIVPLVTFFWTGLTTTTGAVWMMGWASAPYDPYWEERYPRRAAMMALAGPLANLALAIVAFAVLKVGIAEGIWVPSGDQDFTRLVTLPLEEPGIWAGVARFSEIMLILNLVLFLFNMFPLPPMDGAAVLAGLFEPARRLRDQLRAGSFGLFGLMIAWMVFPRIFSPIYRLMTVWLYS